jgi:hypothetical protein
VRDDEQPAVYIVPTELGRSDAFNDLALLAVAFLGLWWLFQRGLPLWVGALVLPFVAIETLTSEAAESVAWVGDFAQALRMLFGHRRAHEWFLAFCHHAHDVTWRRWSHRARARLRSSLRRTQRWVRRQNARTRRTLSRVCSWGSVTRYRLSARLAKSKGHPSGEKPRDFVVDGSPSCEVKTRLNGTGGYELFPSPSKE